MVQAGGENLNGEINVKKLNRQIENYQNELHAINQELLQAPVGRLVCRGSSYTHVVNNKKITITNDSNLIRKLARKKYLLTKQKQLENNIITLKQCQDELDISSVQNIVNSFTPTYKELPITYFYHYEVIKWQNEKYEQNNYQVEKRIYHTKNGVAVRSKSEVIIANMLEDYQIPYRYEPLFKMDYKNKYPDFVIKNPFTNKTIIWEHFGALNQEGYEQSMNEKMNWFLNNGYRIGDNLIYTFEFHITTPARVKDLIENVIL